MIWLPLPCREVREPTLETFHLHFDISSHPLVKSVIGFHLGLGKSRTVVAASRLASAFARTAFSLLDR